MTGNKRVLITGASGFLGSHIAHRLVSDGYIVYATRRSTSDLWRCKTIADRIIWIDTEDEGWQNQIIELSPELLIHAAWEGVKTSDREDWTIQLKNFYFSSKLFQAVLEGKAKKIITLGSQAEYGNFSYRISENEMPKPIDAYGSIKLLICNHLRILCEQHQVPWYWMRVFSVFGPKENTGWLFPQVIRNLMQQLPINLTAGEQCYDYLYITDFVNNLMKVTDFKGNDAGVYNLCSGVAKKLKDILKTIPVLLKVPDDLLHFGVVPYRLQQSMYMEGNCTKFEEIFGMIQCCEIEQAIEETIQYYRDGNWNHEGVA